MSRLQYFGLGVLSLVMFFFSVLFIGTGRILYGPDAFIIAIMGYSLVRSIMGFIESIKGLKHSKKELNNSVGVQDEK